MDEIVESSKLNSEWDTSIIVLDQEGFVLNQPFK
jgi:hypothetical protein